MGSRYGRGGGGGERRSGGLQVKKIRATGHVHWPVLSIGGMATKGAAPRGGWVGGVALGMPHRALLQLSHPLGGWCRSMDGRAGGWRDRRCGWAMRALRSWPPRPAPNPVRPLQGACFKPKPHGRPRCVHRRTQSAYRWTVTKYHRDAGRVRAPWIDRQIDCQSAAPPKRTSNSARRPPPPHFVL